jgi:hypothetical protein
MTRRRGAFAERSRSEIERDRDISDTTAVYPAISDNRKQTGVTHARDATRRSVRRSVPPSLPPTRSAGETRAPPPEMGSGARESLARGDSFRASAAESVKSVIGRPPGVAREGGREGGRGGGRGGGGGGQEGASATPSSVETIARRGAARDSARSLQHHR